MLARDTERQILPLVIIGAALIIAGFAMQAAIGATMTAMGARALLAILSGSGAVLVFIALLLVGFYRDPQRSGTGGLLSPADGKVIFVEECNDTHVGAACRIAIFMSPLDVHVNRVPTSGRLLSRLHEAGGYRPAFRKESELNERLTTHWRATGDEPDELPDGTPFKMVQIAGSMARRIVPWILDGEVLKRGDRFGIIKFGSRVDLYLPATVTPQVKAGSRVKAGKSVVATVGPSPARSNLRREAVAQTA